MANDPNRESPQYPMAISTVPEDSIAVAMSPPGTETTSPNGTSLPFHNPKSNPSRFTSYNYNPPDFNKIPTEPMPNNSFNHPMASSNSRPTSSQSNMKAAHRISPPRTSSKYPPSPANFSSNMPGSAAPTPTPGSGPSYLTQINTSKSRPSSSAGHSVTNTTPASTSHLPTGFTSAIRGQSRLQAHILLINPNSTPDVTAACLASLAGSLPSTIEVTGYTAPRPAPSAIESTTDAILSTEACIRDLGAHSAVNHETVKNFDGLLVACYSKHPLIDALREMYDVPVLGIMEASLYTARILGGRFGIVATSPRSKLLQADAVAAYGLSHFYVGSEPTHLGVLELASKSKEEVHDRVAAASKKLVVAGADVILLGCAGMTDHIRAAKDAVREKDGRRLVNVVDGVEAGVVMLAGLVGMSVPTSKKGIYAGEREGRRRRGQNWL